LGAKRDTLKNAEALESGLPTDDVLVVAFDMCSSSKILEDLTRTKSLDQFDRLLKNLQVWLAANAEASGYVLYKFTGDGWIMLFPAEKLNGTRLMAFLLQLCERHQKLRRDFVDGHLESTPDSIGITIGMDIGPVKRIRFATGDVEFVGRAINVACRLQTAVKDKTPGPDYRCLMSRKVYNKLMKNSTEFYFGPADRVLRNISGGERYHCYKVDFTMSMK
jgi:class 3 adenylate cyclase